MGILALFPRFYMQPKGFSETKTLQPTKRWAHRTLGGTKAEILY